MPVMKLSKRNIDAIKNPTRQEEYRDPSLKGYSLIAYASGRKVFMLRYKAEGKRRTYKLGDYGELTPDAAKAEANEWLVKVRKGIDPQDVEAAKMAMPTFAGWVNEYIQEVRQRKKRPDVDERFLAWAVKRYGSKKLDKVTRADVQNHMKKLHKVGKTAVTANRYHACVRACLNEAIRAGHIQFNVSANIRHYPEPTPRARVLSDDELSRVLDATDRGNDVFVQTAMHMLIETGARKTEVLSARWEDILFEDGLWRMPDTKAGKPQIIPLSKATLARLRVLPRVQDCPWLFPGKDGGHRGDIKRGWAQVRKDAGVPYVRLHDVRRTFGLHIARSAGLHVASKLLRHSSIKVTEQHYAPLGVDELRAALEKRSADVTALPDRGNQA